MPIKLAQEYGITPWVIASACERLVVPRPKCGDWMRMRHGKRVRKTPLPEAPGAPESVTLRRWRERLPKGTCAEIPKVPEDLRGCDSLTSAIRRALEKEKPWDRGLLRVRGDGVFNVNISRVSVHRAMLLLEAILRAGKQKGWRFESGDKASVSVRIAEDAVAFGIEERVTRTEQPPKPEDEKYAWMSKKYDHNPTGLLSIRIYDHLGSGGLRSSWNDSKRQRLEDQLGNVLIGFETASEELSGRGSHTRNGRWNAPRGSGVTSQSGSTPSATGGRNC